MYGLGATLLSLTSTMETLASFFEPKLSVKLAVPRPPFISTVSLGSITTFSLTSSPSDCWRSMHHSIPEGARKAVTFSSSAFTRSR